MMDLVAVKTTEYKDRKGLVWFKNWELRDSDTKKIYGTMTFNSGWAPNDRFSVVISSVIHHELGGIASEAFGTAEMALAWARRQIEALPEPTVEQLYEAVERIRSARYSDEMHDDFAYTNGKIAHWDRLERIVLDKIESLTHT